MLNAEGTGLLRALIFKMWSLREARENGDCASIATEINAWLPPGMKVDAADVQRALGRNEDGVTLNIAVLRDKIDRMPALYSARLNGDYQAILNEVRADPECTDATLADIVEAMAHRVVPTPEIIVAGSANLVGIASIG